jgi:hypothetical protein
VKCIAQERPRQRATIVAWREVEGDWRADVTLATGVLSAANPRCSRTERIVPRSPATLNQPMRLADRLDALRRDRFVGRNEELAAFRSALLAADPPFSVLYIFGPGGIGKTALLREFARSATACERRVTYLDARHLEPTRAGLLAALGQTSAAPDGVWPANSVLIFDTYELLAPLDAWLRESVLAELPASTTVVLAGRNPPDPAWRVELEWGGLTRTMALPNLSAAESQTYLTARGIAAEQHAAVLAFTHGHPLALSLVADALNRGDSIGDFHPRDSPDVVRTLLERLLQGMPDARRRSALQVCVLAWATTADLLADVLDLPDASELFAWLQGLSLIETGPHGLFPHDIAREVLDAEFRWRNPEELQAVSHRISASLYARLRRQGRATQQRIWFDILHLHRHDPFYRPYFDWDALGHAYAEPAAPADHPAILAMVKEHQGEGSMEIAHHWLVRQPDAFLVYRDLTGALFGFMGQIALHEASPEDVVADPAVAAAHAFMQQRGPMRPGEEAVHLRFWMHRESYQDASAAVNLTAINGSIFWSTHPRLAWNFIAVGDPAFLEPHFASVHMWREPDADFEVAGHRYAVFAHDWRVEPLEAWLQVKADPKRLPEPGERPTAARLPARVLSHEQFVAAVRQALRDYARLHALAENPLIHSRLVATPSAAALQACLREAVATLRANPKDAKFHRALWHTYFAPAPTQEQAAELLGLPFNTYRYHLNKGIARVTDILWQQELAGGW